MSYYLHRHAGAMPPPPISDKLRLYHVDMNPYGHRVLLILEAKRTKYEVYKLDPLNLPEWFKTANPRLKIPVLEIPTDQGDKYLFESVVICDYLDEKYGRTHLHSRDPFVKAQDRLLIERFNELIKGSLECFDTNFAYGSEQIVQTLDIFEKELNLRVKIPVLEIPTDQGDKYLFESVVICDYLDEKYGRTHLHSRDPFVKAQDRLLIERFNELIKGSLECFDTNFAYGSEQIVQTLDIFEKELNLRGTNYFGGDRPGMLDYMIWPWVERLYLLRCINERKFDEKRSLFPNFADWGDQMQLDEVVKKHANSPAEYFDYYKNARTHSMGYYL